LWRCHTGRQGIVLLAEWQGRMSAYLEVFADFQRHPDQDRDEEQQHRAKGVRSIHTLPRGESAESPTHTYFRLVG
jgi:hypothetical protein